MACLALIALALLLDFLLTDDILSYAHVLEDMRDDALLAMDELF